MFLYKRILYVKLLCSHINFPFMFCNGCCLVFPYSFGIFQTSAAHGRLSYLKHVNSNLNADQSNFLANKTVRLTLELCMKNIFTQNSCPKPNYKIVY